MTSRYIRQSRVERVSSFLTAIRKAAVIGCCAVAAISACGHRDAASNGTDESGIDANSLIVGVEEARRIANFNGLTSYPKADIRQPSRHDSNSPAPCRAVFDQESTFGSGWMQFRSVTYNGATNTSPGQARGIADIIQSVGIYPDEDSAHTAFDQLISTLTSCTALHAQHYDFTIDKKDSSTVALNSDLWKIIYRVKSSVLIDVAALGFTDSDQVATTVAQTITDRIN